MEHVLTRPGLTGRARGRAPDVVHPSSADAAWLRMDGPLSRMVITAVMLTERPLPLATLARVVQERLLGYERFRKPLIRDARRVAPEPFALEHHLHRVALPEGAGERELWAWIGERMREPLPPGRPLWEVSLVERYGAGSAVVWRLHHALADGIALMRVLLSAVDEPPPPSALSLPTRTTGAFHGVRLAVGGPLSLGKLLGLPRDRALPKPPLTGRKRVAWSEPLALEEVKRIGRRCEATVNDVLLSAVSGALHAWLEERGGRPPRTLRALVPFDLRSVGRESELGNQFGLVYLTLPVGPLSARARLAEVKRRMARIKRTPEALVAYGILEGIGRVVPAVSSLAIRLFARKASLVLTNVAGPTGRLTLGGVPLGDLFFWVPQAGSLGLGLSILSYAGRVRVGVAADEARLPDPAHLAALVPRELAALAGA